MSGRSSAPGESNSLERQTMCSADDDEKDKDVGYDDESALSTWGSLVAVDGVMTLQHGDARKAADIMVDSGAAKVVAPLSFASEDKVRPPAGS